MLCPTPPLPGRQHPPAISSGGVGVIASAEAVGTAEGRTTDAGDGAAAGTMTMTTTATKGTTTTASQAATMTTTTMMANVTEGTMEGHMSGGKSSEIKKPTSQSKFVNTTAKDTGHKLLIITSYVHIC